jgi:type IV pilus assembly protein PilM
MEIPEGIIVYGLVRGHERLREVIRALLQEKNSDTIPKEGISVFLLAPESFVFTHLFNINGEVSSADLSSRIKNEAEAIVPLPPDELLSDFRVVPSERGDGVTTVLYAAVPKEYVEGYMSVLEGLHFFPAVLETEMMSLARVLISDHITVTAILDIGRTTTNLGIFDDDSVFPKFSLTIPIAGNAFTEALMFYRKVEREEAERMKSTEGFDVHADEGRTLVILQERVQAILREIEKAFRYYEKTSNKKVERVVLTGGGSLIPFLDAYLAVNLHCKVIIGDPISQMKEKISFPNNYSPLQLAPLLGLFLRIEMRREPERSINLLSGWFAEHSEIRHTELQKTWRLLGVCVFLTALLLSGYLFYQMLYLPFVRYKEEARSRTQSTVPFSPSSLPEAVNEVTKNLGGNDVQGSTSTTTLTTLGEDGAPLSNTLPTETPTTTTKQLPFVTIMETPTGWLNVRTGPGPTFPVLRRVFPGDSFPLEDAQGDWLKIALSDGVFGWVRNDFAQKLDTVHH